MLPFDIYEQDRQLKIEIALDPKDYIRIKGDTEMNTQDGRTTTVRLKIKATTDHPTKPTRFDVHVTDFHGEVSPNYTRFTASKKFVAPVKLAKNEYFVKFISDTFKFDNAIEGRRHGWVKLPASGIVTKVAVMFDGMGDDDQKRQKMIASLLISYRVVVHIPNQAKVAALENSNQG